MKLFNFNREIWLPKPVADLFPFFADAQNLETLTPPWVQFKILTPLPIRMHAGALIDYRLKIHGFPVRWQTEITAWEPPFRFVDEQKRGPYRLWIHEHRFVEKDGGTLMTDQIRYAVYGGGLIEKLFVRRDVEKIFDYRNRKMSELFGGTQEPLPLAG
ncbi:MAG: SRPBCC family protein [Verrucomicrobiales bacterium]|nr:SRPBCC family protein [Verrucomicrobiales bacterium]